MPEGGRTPLPRFRAVTACRALFRAKPHATVLIDGRAGAGKSMLATEIGERTGALVVRMDDLYPGWDGLAAAATEIRAQLLAPRAAGRAGHWQRWDWGADAAAEWVSVPRARGVVIEGCGTLSGANRALADLGIWVELDRRTRRRRALDRDGDVFRRQWRRWARQERALIRAERPEQHADLVVDGR